MLSICRWLFIFLLSFGLGGIAAYLIQRPTLHWNDEIGVVWYKKHCYLRFGSGSRFSNQSIVHDPDCPCYGRTHNYLGEPIIPAPPEPPLPPWEKQ